MTGKKMTSSCLGWLKPTFTSIVKTNKDFKSYFYSAMLYAHYELTSAELKREVMVYLKKLDTKHPLLARMEKLDENRFVTIGKYVYILNHGGEIPEDIIPKLLPALEKTIDEEEMRIATREKEIEISEGKARGSSGIDLSSKPIISIQDRIKEKTREVAGEIEGWVDDFFMDKKLPVKTVEDFIKLFKANDLKTPHIRVMQEIFDRRINEISKAVEGKDKELVEAYANYTRVELKKCDQFNQNLLKACSMMQEVAKVERSPRKKKPISQEKIVSKLKFKKDDPSLGIVSLNPVNIVGAKDVWCFDTKTRKLIRYIADDLIGPISVKGTTLIGYNEAKSLSKTLRKPAAQLAEFKKCGKAQLRSFMDSISTIGITPTGRINENCIILRIDK